MAIHDYFRANDAKTAMQAMRLGGPLGPNRTFDGVAIKKHRPSSYPWNVGGLYSYQAMGGPHCIDCSHLALWSKADYQKGL
jgi:hypothetical protein